MPALKEAERMRARARVSFCVGLGSFVYSFLRAGIFAGALAGTLSLSLARSLARWLRIISGVEKDAMSVRECWRALDYAWQGKVDGVGVKRESVFNWMNFHCAPDEDARLGWSQRRLRPSSWPHNRSTMTVNATKS